MDQNKTYSFGFTAVSLQVPLMAALAQRITDGKITLNELHPDHLEKERSKTAKREFTEMKRRLATLSPDELNLMSSGTFDQQQQIALIAFARAYRYFYDFMMEVIAEKVSVFDFELSDMDYNIYYNRKAIDYPEVEALTLLTQQKIKQVFFKVLEQAGLINSVRKPHLNLPILTSAVIDAIKTTNPRDLLLFSHKL